jgi:alpha-ketoglutarate-dependent taurine dioxygenase
MINASEAQSLESALTVPIHEDFINPGQTLPVVIHAPAEPEPLAWMREHRPAFELLLDRYGAILFRGFPVDRVETFHRFTVAIAGELLEYKERSSPRHEEGDRVYTSTDYPADQPIFLHNEHSYAVRFPRKLFFCCLTPANKGGQTPLADVRRVLARIDPQIRQRFAEKKWMLVRNFGSGFGLPWTTTFQTSDRAQVEAYCSRNGIDCTWKPDGGLCTRQVRPAIFEHPRTKERVWFNHATFFHISTLPANISRMLLSGFGDDELPNNTFYGDGSAIEPETMEALRVAHEAETVLFDWECGDVLFVDNMLVAHGRTSYTGSRRVLVAMADSYSPPDV